MLPASSKGGGQCMGFPDVCKTPAPPAPFAPIPYPNMTMVTGASGTIMKVQISGKDAVVVDSAISDSKGDEAGTLKGMVSQMNMNRVGFKTASSKVFCGGKKLCYVSSATEHNGNNANLPVGAQIAPSQVKVLAGL